MRFGCEDRLQSLLLEAVRVNVPKVASTRRPQTKPKLGQHFLASEDLAARIVDALGDVSQSTVLEIGPGRGIMTSLLAKRARRLIAVELDRVLAAQLRLKFGMSRNVEIIEGDVLAIDFDSLFGPKPGLSRPGIDLKPEPVKVVGNLPYYITSDILLRLFEFSKYFDEHCDHGAARSCRPHCGGAGRTRLRNALRDGAVICSRGKTVYSAAGGVHASAESAFDGAAA